ncbi:Holliday junction branch migration protein RuvA [Amphibacillus sediminis]|uniref:Holliday junction branch migration protein RuvA n=1 Tax=Amphibacillus sediminis TaxID=360185 RepID=UPI0008334DA4|nr:Holliday junction branch migration protein RuvA [Amphibacillus sediminis]
MITYLKGHLTEMLDVSVIVEVNGIGYEIICANPFYFQDSLNQSVKIYTYHYVREDAQILYGFRNQEEKQLFSHILNVSGIGPKGALSIVGNGSVDQFVTAIEQEDESYLTQFPGVGKKTARQMILDLKGKLSFMIGQNEAVSEMTKGSSHANNSEALQEAIEALKALGYKEREIKMIIPQLKQSNITNTDELIRKGLALLIQ